MILVMETIPLATVKARLSEVVDRVARQQDRITITRNGRPVAIIVSPDDLEGLEETLAILSDKRLMAKIRKGVAEAKAGKGIPLKEVAEGLRRR
jgi:prevent-host-death family protein